MTALIDASDVHAFMPVATAAALRRAGLEMRPRTDLAAVGIQALTCMFESDVKGAVALMRRGLLNTARHNVERAYIKDILLNLLAASGDFDAMERLLAERDVLPDELVPLFQATEALFAAARGDRKRSRRLAGRALSTARQSDAPLGLERILSRCAAAAYHRQDYDEARELALESARLAETRAAYFFAASGYSFAGTIAHDWNGDGALAAFYYERMSAASERAGNRTLLRSSLAAGFNTAAERFDAASCAVLRKALLAECTPPQLQENHITVIAEALVQGWNADFSAACASLEGHARDSRISEQQTALVEALLSLVDVSRWDVDAARRRSRSALHRTARQTGPEPLHARHSRHVARVVAATTCFLIGDRVRGERALSARFDPDQRYRRILTAKPLRASDFPETLRGYGEFARVAAEHAARSRPGHGLTVAELQVLRLLGSGETLAGLAGELRKSKNTLARQVESIYDKLDVRNRAHAVEKARDYGLLL
jgi:DNA-binding CsgD family transcriptional regulator